MFGPSLVAMDRPRVDAGPMALASEETGILLAGLAVGAALLGFACRALRRDPFVRDFLWTSVVIPIAILLLAFSRVPMLHEKFMIMTAPALLVGAAIGARGESRGVRPTLTVAWVGMVVLGMLAFFWPQARLLDRWVVHGHPYGKEQWRDAREWVASRAAPTDVVVLAPRYLHVPWDYYDRGRSRTVVLDRLGPYNDTIDLAIPGVEVARRAFLVTASIRSDDRSRLANAIGRVIARSAGPPPRAPRDTVLFPRQWGVWVYEFDARPADGAATGSSP
jgi:hypothetical protein